MSEQNMAASRRFLEEAFSQGRLEVLDELVGDDFVDHDPQNPFPDRRGAEGAKQQIAMYRSAFPDLTFTIDLMLDCGDLIVTRWTGTGTHEGELMGMPATHRRGTVTGITIDRFQDGKLVESWVNWDTLGLLQQIGAVPAPARA